jgi:Peptidase family M23
MRTRTTVTILGAVTVIAACSPSTESPTTEPPASTPSASTPSPTPAPGGPLRGPEPSALTPIIANVVSPPVPVPATDGRVHLAYEVQLTNVLSQEVTLTALTVLDRDVSLLSQSGDQLAKWTRILGTPTPTTKLGHAQTALIWVDVALDKDVAVPTQLTHVVGVRPAEPKPPLLPPTMDLTVAPTTVQTRKPIVISPPLAGPGWLNGGGCCDLGAHRMALNPINGQLWAAERYAIDYLQLQSDGRLFTGDSTKLESFPYFGADIHAVADGPVVSVVDGLPEQVPGTGPTGLTLDQYPGNHIVQDLGDGNYALYAHIKTGTVEVKPGDRLTTGQVIGAVGDTGNSDAPHLHFHVMSMPDPLRSDGLPFVFNQFRLDSRVDVPTDDLGSVLESGVAPMQPGFTARDESNVMPLDLDVMTYADR